MDGNILKRIRQEKGYSLTKLGKLTGISKSYLSLLERGIQKNPSIEIIEKIAKVLEVDMNYLILPTENKNPNRSTLKLEISLSEDGMNRKKLEQIQELISLLGKKKRSKKSHSNGFFIWAKMEEVAKLVSSIVIYYLYCNNLIVW